MGLLTAPALDALLASGCSCGEKRLEFETYVDGRYTLVGGEPYGSVTWVYKGETFVDGVYEVTCVSCKKVAFSADVCPRCNAQGALGGVMSSPNVLAVPHACPTCRAEKVEYTAMLPARVLYEGIRAQKARPLLQLGEDGFHGVRAECKACGVLAKVSSGCPLCAAPGPLRPRPT